jgi:hypothetical protein
MLKCFHFHISCISGIWPNLLMDGQAFGGSTKLEKYINSIEPQKHNTMTKRNMKINGNRGIYPLRKVVWFFFFFFFFFPSS